MNINILLSNWDRLKEIPQGIEQAVDLAARFLAIEGMNEMRLQLKRDQSIAFSRTINSVDSRVVDPRKIGTAHYRIGPSTQYAYFIEKGRAPGKAPPPQKIIDWMRIRGIRLPEQDQARVAFLIGRKIERDGIKAKPFVSVVAERKRWRDDFARLVSPLVNKEVNEVLR